MEIKLKYIGFLKRIYRHGKFFFLIGFFAIWVAFALTSQFYLSMLIGIMFLIVIFISVSEWNIYYIQYLKIDNNLIKLKVYKYNSVLIEGEYDLNDFNLKIERASASKRGVSYKMVCKIQNTNFKQYEINNWNHELFQKIHQMMPKSS
jgi:hypothetical protein